MLTRAEILAMTPGAELNREVAQKVMRHVVARDEVFGYLEGFTDEDGGHAWGPLQAYSEDITAAQLVVDRMLQDGCEDAIYWADFGLGKYSRPEGICKAALLAVLEEHAKQISDDILQQAFGEDPQTRN